MPPKKPGIYLADYEDCARFVDRYCSEFSTLNQFLAYEPFATTPSRFFPAQRSAAVTDAHIIVVNSLFGLMDSLETTIKEFRVAKNALEMALLDILGQITGQSTAELILGPEWCLASPTYYTVAMNSDSNEVKASASFGFAHTPYLKLKMDKNVAFWREWLPQLYDYCRSLGTSQRATLNGNSVPFVWSVDANADWTPEVARDMLSLLLPYKSIISMIEQPFPAHFSSDDEISLWCDIKREYAEHGFVIYADESVSTSEDVVRLEPMCHGVNIKLDKTGGVREALRTWQRAKDLNMGVWIGIMVSSRLSTSMAACILPLSTLGGDLDGQLLVSTDSDLFTGGLQWDVKTGLCSPPTTSGLGLTRKN